jgi:hypothetical protein
MICRRIFERLTLLFQGLPRGGDRGTLQVLKG